MFRRTFHCFNYSDKKKTCDAVLRIDQLRQRPLFSCWTLRKNYFFSDKICQLLIFFIFFFSFRTASESVSGDCFWASSGQLETFPSVAALEAIQQSIAKLTLTESPRDVTWFIIYSTKFKVWLVNDECINRLQSANGGYRVQYGSCYGNYRGSAKFNWSEKPKWLKAVYFVRRNSCWPAETKGKKQKHHLINTNVVECLGNLGKWKKIQS